jgi:hypothetical protein
MSHSTLSSLRALLMARRPGEPRLPYETDLLALVRKLAGQTLEVSDQDRWDLISRELSVAVAIDNENSRDPELLDGARALLAVLQPDDEGDLRRAIASLEERISSA